MSWCCNTGMRIICQFQPGSACQYKVRGDDEIRIWKNKLGLSWAMLSSNWNLNLVLLVLRFVAIDFMKNTTVKMGFLQTRTVTEKPYLSLPSEGTLAILCNPKSLPTAAKPQLANNLLSTNQIGSISNCITSIPVGRVESDCTQLGWTSLLELSLLKIIQWSPLWIIFKEKTKIVHLLPQRSTCRDDHLLQT